MAKLIVFSGTSYSGQSKEYRSNDPDLAANGDDFVLASAIAIEGSWTLYDAAGSAGTSISLDAAGGPDGDGTFKDPADWSGGAPFHVLSIQH